MNQLVMQYRGGQRIVINATYMDAVRLVRTARGNMFPVVETATYNGLEVAA